MGPFRSSTALLFRASPLARLKLLALPLTRPPASSASPPAFLLHVKRTPPTDINLKNDDGSTKDLPYVTRATVWAADQWAKLGQAEENTWKRKAFKMGDRFMDKIEFEEWALKAIDPALAPKPFDALKNGTEGAREARKTETVDLMYPKSLLEPQQLVDALKKQLDSREPHHRKAMWRCLIGAPLTFPFAIIPIVPNFPLFYVLWRAWSHWRAWKASQYLKAMLSSSQLNITASSELDGIYESTPASSSSPKQLLLTQEKVPKLVEAFSLSEEEFSELRRAVAQSEQRLQQVSTEKEGQEQVGTKKDE